MADPVLLISKKSRITKCITGRNLTVSDNSKVQYSVILDNVKIGKEYIYIINYSVVRLLIVLLGMMLQ